MRAVIQRVTSASVTADGTETGRIGKGLLILVGMESGDTVKDAEWLAEKIVRLRIFDDADGVMNLSVNDMSGELLVVSQFTLHANIKKGNRPSYIRAARPEEAIPLYEHFLKKAGELTGTMPQAGLFGAAMQITLVNDGPVTILADSRNRE